MDLKKDTAGSYWLPADLKVKEREHYYKQFWSFLRERKAWWLAPAITMLVIVGALIVLSQASALSPFIYTLF